MGKLLLGRSDASYTPLQGQYLAYIHTYTLLHRVPPAERDMQMFFQVTPPSIHNMVLTLERLGLLARTPGKPRSLRVLVPSASLPALRDPAGETEPRGRPTRG